MPNFDMPAVGTWEQRGGWVVRSLMTEFGLTDFQAAGLVGNLGFESGGFDNLHEDGQPEGVGGYGWGQWTASRRKSFMAWCASHNLDWQSDEANYGYLLTELKGAYKGTIAVLQKAGTLEDAVFSVGQTYERPGGTTPTHLPGYDGRLGYAKRALAGAQAPGPTPIIDPIGRIKRIQIELGVVSDGAFGRRSRAALTELLRAAGQPGI